MPMPSPALGEAAAHALSLHFVGYALRLKRGPDARGVLGVRTGVEVAAVQDAYHLAPPCALSPRWGRRMGNGGLYIPCSWPGIHSAVWRRACPRPAPSVQSLLRPLWRGGPCA